MNTLDERVKEGTIRGWNRRGGIGSILRRVFKRWAVQVGIPSSESPSQPSSLRWDRIKSGKVTISGSSSLSCSLRLTDILPKRECILPNLPCRWALPLDVGWTTQQGAELTSRAQGIIKRNIPTPSSSFASVKSSKKFLYVTEKKWSSRTTFYPHRPRHGLVHSY